MLLKIDGGLSSIGNSGELGAGTEYEPTMILQMLIG